jgi:hypothetical protein
MSSAKFFGQSLRLGTVDPPGNFQNTPRGGFGDGCTRSIRGDCRDAAAASSSATSKALNCRACAFSISAAALTAVREAGPFTLAIGAQVIRDRSVRHQYRAFELQLTKGHLSIDYRRCTTARGNGRATDIGGDGSDRTCHGIGAFLALRRDAQTGRDDYGPQTTFGRLCVASSRRPKNCVLRWLPRGTINGTSSSP